MMNISKRAVWLALTLYAGIFWIAFIIGLIYLCRGRL